MFCLLKEGIIKKKQLQIMDFVLKHPVDYILNLESWFQEPQKVELDVKT